MRLVRSSTTTGPASTEISPNPQVDEAVRQSRSGWLVVRVGARTRAVGFHGLSSTAALGRAARRPRTGPPGSARVGGRESVLEARR